MANTPSPGTAPPRTLPATPHVSRATWIFALVVTLAAVLGAVILPKGYAQAAFSDIVEAALVLTTALLAFRNFLHSNSRVRIFWFLTFLGAALWSVSAGMWAFYEVWLKHPVPSSPVVDILIFVMVVPLTTAFAAAPHREARSPFRAFGLLDVSMLMIYSLYLYGFGVFSYLLLPGAISAYNFRYNVADAIANQIFVVGAAAAMLSAHGRWKMLFRWYFFAAASFALSTDLINAAIDMGRYSAGSLYDTPLMAGLAGFVCMAFEGRELTNLPSAKSPDLANESHESPGRTTVAFSHLAMLAVLSTPLIGLWLLSDSATPLLTFRLTITLLTMLALALLLFIKEDLLTSGLRCSLDRLSSTYTSIDRFKSRLSESEKMASLGELVAHVANQIKQCMTVILDVAARLACRPDVESRAQNMAGKIGIYAQRTDALVDNMLRFAQETPMRLASVDVKPVLESALQLSRVTKIPNVKVSLTQDGPCPPVHADSSQLLHVFLELISNALDALQEVNGGSLEIKISCSDSQVSIEFLDSGPGLREPARVFDPFYTTKVVGKGTGLGLSTCYGILQQHQGEITCRNRLTGGACFTLLLPLASQTDDTDSHVPSLEGAL